MASRTEANTVYAAGLVQGIVLVTFPAASTGLHPTAMPLLAERRIVL